jgi:hypothetical protein
MNLEPDNGWLLELFAQMATQPVVVEVPRIAPKPCKRCDGRGSLHFYSHVKGSECFACGGTGLHRTRDRIVDPEF